MLTPTHTRAWELSQKEEQFKCLDIGHGREVSLKEKKKIWTVSVVAGQLEVSGMNGQLLSKKEKGGNGNKPPMAFQGHSGIRP